MVMGATILKMGGDPYYEAPIVRQTMGALFAVQVSNVAGPGTTTLNVTVEHRNRSDTSWGSAGSFAVFTTAGVHTLELSGLKELIRVKLFISGASTTATSGVCVFVPPPQWLID